jgi:hypothetical protein
MERLCRAPLLALAVPACVLLLRFCLTTALCSDAMVLAVLLRLLFLLLALLALARAALSTLVLAFPSEFLFCASIPVATLARFQV